MSRDIFKLAAKLNEEQKVYLHDLNHFINGVVSVTKRKTVKLTIEIPIDQLGGIDDVRCVMAPHSHRNKMVPMLCFIDNEAEVPA